MVGPVTGRSMDLCGALHKSIYVEYGIMWSSVFTYTLYPRF